MKGKNYKKVKASEKIKSVKNVRKIRMKNEVLKVGKIGEPPYLPQLMYLLCKSRAGCPLTMNISEDWSKILAGCLKVQG